jgi:hypothetical protein
MTDAEPVVSTASASGAANMSAMKSPASSADSLARNLTLRLLRDP